MFEIVISEADQVKIQGILKLRIIQFALI